MKKTYFIEDSKIEVFLIKDANYSELKFFVNGNHHYTVSNNSYAKIVDSIETAIQVFNDSFFYKNNVKEIIVRDEIELENKVKSLGFN